MQQIVGVESHNKSFICKKCTLSPIIKILVLAVAAARVCDPSGSLCAVLAVLLLR